jgi:2-hydroxychromene-2-carboxylate isomerase
MRDLREQGEVELTYAFFSLEVNASEPGLPLTDAAPRYGDALAALALARRDGGTDAVQALYVALGQRLHEQKRSIEPEIVREAADEAGLPGLAERAETDSDLGEEIVAEYHAARALDVFGVPTLQIEGGKTMYGPILAVGPTGDEGVVLWHAVRELLARDSFFELKRWPRDLRPGGAPTGPAA